MVRPSSNRGPRTFLMRPPMMGIPPRIGMPPPLPGDGDLAGDDAPTLSLAGLDGALSPRRSPCCGGLAGDCGGRFAADEGDLSGDMENAALLSASSSATEALRPSGRLACRRQARAGRALPTAQHSSQGGGAPREDFVVEGEGLPRSRLLLRAPEGAAGDVLLALRAAARGAGGGERSTLGRRTARSKALETCWAGPGPHPAALGDERGPVLVCRRLDRSAELHRELICGGEAGKEKGHAHPQAQPRAERTPCIPEGAKERRQAEAPHAPVPTGATGAGPPLTARSSSAARGSPPRPSPRSPPPPASSGPAERGPRRDRKSVV